MELRYKLRRWVAPLAAAVAIAGGALLVGGGTALAWDGPPVLTAECAASSTTYTFQVSFGSVESNYNVTVEQSSSNTFSSYTTTDETSSSEPYDFTLDRSNGQYVRAEWTSDHTPGWSTTVSGERTLCESPTPTPTPTTRPTPTPCVDSYGSAGIQLDSINPCCLSVTSAGASTSLLDNRDCTTPTPTPTPTTRPTPTPCVEYSYGASGTQLDVDQNCCTNLASAGSGVSLLSENDCCLNLTSAGSGVSLLSENDCCLNLTSAGSGASLLVQDCPTPTPDPCHWVPGVGWVCPTPTPTATPTPTPTPTTEPTPTPSATATPTPSPSPTGGVQGVTTPGTGAGPTPGVNLLGLTLLVLGGSALVAEYVIGRRTRRDKVTIDNI